MVTNAGILIESRHRLVHLLHQSQTDGGTLMEAVVQKLVAA